jgi:hypothetical protein
MLGKIGEWEIQLRYLAVDVLVARDWRNFSRVPRKRDTETGIPGYRSFFKTGNRWKPKTGVAKTGITETRKCLEYRFWGPLNFSMFSNSLGEKIFRAKIRENFFRLDPESTSTEDLDFWG